MSTKIPVSLALLVAAAALAPIFGGQYASDQLPLMPGGLFSAILGSGETPTLTNALIAVLVIAAGVMLLLRRRVLQIPNQTLGALTPLFVFVLAASVLASSFRSVSIVTFAEWATYGIAFFTAVAATGRERGPKLVCLAIFAGCVVVALRGLSEYGQMRSIDPTWRIFGGWVNPNATAAMLLVGLFLGLGETLNRERIYAGLAGLGTALIVFAIMLTGSKGALSLAMPICIVVFCATLSRKPSVGGQALMAAAVVVAGLITGLCFLKGLGWVALIACLVLGLALLALAPEGRVRAARVALVAVAALCLVGLLAVSTAASKNTDALSPFTRVSASGETQEQSSSFRLQLWKSAADLIRMNPVGYGLGTYAFESGRPGRTTQTKLAHNAYLQLGAEASVAAPLVLLALLGYWFYLMLRRPGSAPPEQSILRAEITAAVAAIAVHSFVDSDFYYFGIGLCVFILLGVGLLVASDAVAPESLPAPFRRLCAAMAVVVWVAFLYGGVIETLKAELRGNALTGNLADAKSNAEALAAIAGIDGEAWELRSQLEPTATAIESDLENAVQLAPSTRNMRQLAAIQQRLGKPATAYATLVRALDTDPNNLLTLSQIMRLEQDAGDRDQATKYATRLVGVESTDYFKTRSIPEVEPTETYAARVYLARNASSPKEAVSLLAPAVAGYQDYLRTTWPLVQRTAKGELQANYAGETLAKAEEHLREGEASAHLLSAAYRSVGDSADASKADAAARDFELALDSAK